MFCYYFKLKHLERIMANIADNVIALQAAVAALDAKVAGLGTPTVDFTPVTTVIDAAVTQAKTDIAAIKTVVDDIDSKITPTV